MNRRGTPSILALFVCVLLASNAAAAARHKSPPRYSPVPWQMTPVDAASLPGRCDADRLALEKNSVDIVPYRTAEVPDRFEVSLEQQMDGLLAGGDPNNKWTKSVRHNPMPTIYFSKAADYYNHRREIQGKLESRLSRMTGKDRERALGNYAQELLFLGEFAKVVTFFGPGSPAGRESGQNGEVNFAMAQALFRLGKYKQSLPYAERAYRQLEDASLDTRWQAMVSAVGAYGQDVFNRKSDLFDLKLVKKLFPKRKWELPFEDATARMGLDKDQWGGTGAAGFVDLDGSGWEDLVLERKYFPWHVYKNVQGRAFEPLTDEKLGGRTPCNQIITNAADIDNDGKPDLVRQCCNFDGKGPNTVLKNKGGMTFEDITRSSGLTWKKSGLSVCWLDYDLDGNVDLLVNDFYGQSKLYRNRGDGTFEDSTEAAGIRTPGGGKDRPDNLGGVGCAAGDLHGTGYPDLFVQGWGWRRFYRNRGNGTFEDATEKAGLGSGEGHVGWYASLLDYDNDGKLDLLVGSYVVTSDEMWSIGPTCVCSNMISETGFQDREWKAASTIFRNNGDGTFTDKGETTRFMPLGAMGYAHADWNNDGHEDIVLSCGGSHFQQIEPYLFYQNNGDGTFTNMTPFAMLGLWGKGHGVGFGDYDHDGCVDMVINNGGPLPGDLFQSRLWHNTCAGANHWLQVSFKPGPGTNGSAIGAVVTMTAGPLTQAKILQSGGSLSVNSLTLHFGLGANAKIDRIVVAWPNGRKDKTTLREVPVDRAIEIDEQTGSYRTLWAPQPKSASAQPSSKKKPSRG
ncbi:MAG: VCBS repeat-containing protein [Elusimicrobia bacterium]|nr:VCBS repeat-containing protein [Elusimicrobiota bacterium]